MKKYNINDLYLCQLNYVRNVTQPQDFFDSYKYDVRFVRCIFCIKTGNQSFKHILNGKTYLTNLGKYQFSIGENMITKAQPLNSIFSPQDCKKKVSIQVLNKLEDMYNEHIEQDLQNKSKTENQNKEQ